MLQRVVHVSAGPLQLLMCASWLSAKLRLMMDMTFLTLLWYFFYTLGSALEGEGSSDPSSIFQRSINTNNILILNFQIVNLSIIIVASLPNDIIVCSDMCSKHSNNIFPTLNALYYKIFQVRSFTPCASS